MLRRSLLLLTAKSQASITYCNSRMNPGIARQFVLAMDRGEGSYMFDKDNKKYLDFTCGIGVTNLGHCHPRLVKTVQHQATKLWHGQVCLGHHAALEDMLREMETVFPKELSNFLLVSTGAEAVEAAMKLSRAATGRQVAVALQGGYHGRTVGAAALTSSKYVYARNMRPLMPGVIIAPFPYTTQLKVPVTEDVSVMSERCLKMLEDHIFQQAHPSEVSMIIVEPVLGEGGYVPVPKSYFQGLRRICDEHGILLVCDEIQTGYGRTGSMFTFEHLGALPDVVIFAKGVANGIPLAGIATKPKFADKQLPGQQGGTYAANAIACATAAEVIRVFRDEKILENVGQRAVELRGGLLDTFVRRRLPVQEVRGRGLMIGVQFDDGVPAGTAGKVATACLERGLMILATSKFETLRFIPPLNVTAAQVQDGLRIFEDSVVHVLKDFTPAKGKTGVTKPCCATPCVGNTPCRSILV